MTNLKIANGSTIKDVKGDKIIGTDELKTLKDMETIIPDVDNNGGFVDVKGVIEAQNPDKKIIVDSIVFKKALKKVLIIARNNIEGKNAAVFEIKNNEMIINAVSSSSKIKEKVAIWYQGESLKVSMNCKYLLDFTEKVHNMLEINFSNSNSAFVLQEEGKPEYKYLTAPLALKD